ncbi:Bicupin, oxalate decarboxylase/oxidase [Schizophyllum commune Loenen D]|nr:Bicupin, oxalate decarboxylase/oxidase [Schizophyllum commune Loenen D]
MISPFGIGFLLFGSALAAPAATSEASASASVSLVGGPAASLSALSSAFAAAPSASIASSSAAPSGSADSVTPVSATVAPVATAANGVAWDPLGASTDEAQPVRGGIGAPFAGPSNELLDHQNPDFLAPPSTDFGNVGAAKWSLSLSPMRLLSGGWVRQADETVMPLADEMAGAIIHLEPGAIREMHWHTIAEWVYLINGTTQVSAVDQQGRSTFATANTGDLWYFPPGVGHHLQATGDAPAEFLLIFKTGLFDAAKTFLVTDWLSHVPFSVIQKNFGATGTDKFSSIPSKQLYIFPGEAPVEPPVAPMNPQGEIPDPFVYPWSQDPVQEFAGGKVRTVDSSTFKISTAFSAAEVTLEPGAMRELHWHTTADEWSFFLEGDCRFSVFTETAARTYDMSPGDIGYVPVSSGHYVENIGNTTARFLEITDSSEFEDISLTQWLALTPPEIVKAHFGVDDETVAALSKTKNRVVPGSS